MSVPKTGLVAVILLAGMAAPAPAQFVSGGFGGSSSVGISSGYYGGYGSYGNYGIPQAYPGYGGYGTTAFIPPVPSNGYFAPIQPYTGPKTYNNLGGLMSTITQQTGRPGSYGNGASTGVARRRRVR